MDETETGTLMRANLLDVFGQRDPAARRAAAERLFGEDVVFGDEEETTHGVPALLERAGAILDRAPAEAVFAADSPVYGTGEQAALTWTFGVPGAQPLARGIDLATIAGGRITRLTTLLAR